MKSDQRVNTMRLQYYRMTWAAVLAAAIAFSASVAGGAAANLVVWDTGSHTVDPADSGARTGWKAVPSELFALEADPAKAASDPGYYGREYSFQGDTVVENHHLAAVFESATGRMTLYSKVPPSPPGNGGLGRRTLECVPLGSASVPGKITRCEILRNAGDEVILEVFFSAKESKSISAVFSFGRNEIIEIKPSATMEGIRVLSPVDYAVVPGFVGDDLIVSPADYPGLETLSVPSEYVFVGFLHGEGAALVATWPKGGQHVQLRLSGGTNDQRTIEAVDFQTDGQGICLAALSAPGIWHREELKPAFLEKDVALTWKKPFDARWKTQLTEAGVRTTFAFRETKGQIWRGVPGSYNYPAWFEGETATFHLSKKVPPKGEAIVYFLEGQNTPPTVLTPVDVMKATLGRALADSLLDPTGRKLRTHHRRGGDGVHRACTCGCTEAIQSVFEAGLEVKKKDEVKEALGDMNFFVQCHVERIDEYTKFAGEMIRFLEAQGNAVPAVKGYCESLEQTVRQIPQEYEVQKENMKSIDHANELTRQTLALTGRQSTNNVAAYMELLKAWRAMGGAQDYVVAQCHMITRKLFQEAGYGALRDGRVLGIAREVRARCRQVLRNPDGYEIWADY